MSKRNPITQIIITTGYNVLLKQHYRSVEVERAYTGERGYYDWMGAYRPTHGYISLASFRRAQRAQLALLERSHE